MEYEHEYIRSWLNDHELISIERLEKSSGCPKGTIRHFINDRRDIPQEHIDSITLKLKDYGFLPMGHE